MFQSCDIRRQTASPSTPSASSKSWDPEVSDRHLAAFLNHVLEIKVTRYIISSGLVAFSDCELCSLLSQCKLRDYVEKLRPRCVNSGGPALGRPGLSYRGAAEVKPRQPADSGVGAPADAALQPGLTRAATCTTAHLLAAAAAQRYMVLACERLTSGRPSQQTSSCMVAGGTVDA